MKIAIPVWMGRVSPVFDVAGRAVLLADTPGGGLAAMQEIVLTHSEPAATVRQLVELGVNRLICGGISAELSETIRAVGIEVLANIHGPIDFALRAASYDGPVIQDTNTLLDVHQTMKET